MKPEEHVEEEGRKHEADNQSEGARKKKILIMMSDTGATTIEMEMLMIMEMEMKMMERGC
eukprot:138539-Hanusia_phi.AAC.1